MTDVSRKELFQKAFGLIRRAAQAETSAPQSDPWPPIRPPGAVRPDNRFLELCTGCGDCALACHQDSILLATGQGTEPAGIPRIDPSIRPCFLCDDPPCVTACTDRALVPELAGVPVAGDQIRIGLAVIDHDRCIPWSGGPDDQCRICYETCPLPWLAIRMDAGGRPTIVEAGCTGCGLCEWKCPTEPASVRIHSLETVSSPSAST